MLSIFSRVHSTLYPTVPVRWSVRWSVGPSIGWSVTAFVFSGIFRAVFASLLLPNRTRLILLCIRPCLFQKHLVEKLKEIVMVLKLLVFTVVVISFKVKKMPNMNYKMTKKAFFFQKLVMEVSQK